MMGRLYQCPGCRRRLGEVRRGEIAVCPCGEAYTVGQNGTLTRTAGREIPGAGAAVDRLARVARVAKGRGR